MRTMSSMWLDIRFGKSGSPQPRVPLSKELRMSRQAIVSILVLSIVLMTPRAAPAQDYLGGDWATIIRSRRCPVAKDCPARVGLVWDSTNALPTYPPAFRGAGIGGDAVVSFGVGADGAVDSSSVTVVRASNTAFKATAISAVRRWRFGFETEGRPAAAGPVQVHFVFAHQGDCKGTPRERWSAWAAPNQVVIGACMTVIPRSQLRQPPK